MFAENSLYLREVFLFFGSVRLLCCRRFLILESFSMELFDFCVDSDTVVGSSLIILSDCCGEVPCFVRFSCILFHVFHVIL